MLGSPALALKPNYTQTRRTATTKKARGGIPSRAVRLTAARRLCLGHLRRTRSTSSVPAMRGANPRHASYACAATRRWRRGRSDGATRSARQPCGRPSVTVSAKIAAETLPKRKTATGSAAAWAGGVASLVEAGRWAVGVVFAIGEKRERNKVHSPRDSEEAKRSPADRTARRHRKRAVGDPAGVQAPSIQLVEQGALHTSCGHPAKRPDGMRAPVGYTEKAASRNVLVEEGNEVPGRAGLKQYGTVHERAYYATARCRDNRHVNGITCRKRSSSPVQDQPFPERRALGWSALSTLRMNVTGLFFSMSEAFCHAVELFSAST